MPAPRSTWQRAAEGLVVVYLSVKDDAVAAALREHGLSTRRGQVQNRKTCLPECHACGGLSPDTAVVWPAMTQRGTRCLQPAVVGAAGAERSDYPAHRRRPLGIEVRPRPRSAPDIRSAGVSARHMVGIARMGVGLLSALSVRFHRQLGV